MQVGPKQCDDGPYCWGCVHNLDSHGGFSCHHPDREYERLPWDNHTPQRCPVLKAPCTTSTKLLPRSSSTGS